jgi:predicted permease
VLPNLRYSFRVLIQNPQFSLTAIVTLALGIGLSTSLFNILYATILRPLPSYSDPDRLTIIWSKFQKMGALRAPSSQVELRDIRDGAPAFEEVGAVWVGNATLTSDSAEAEQLKTGFVTWNFFHVLGVNPELGRTFVREEEGLGGRPAIVLSHGFWQRRFGRDKSIIGRAVRINGHSYTVVGVLSPVFQPMFAPDANVPRSVDAWVPFPYDLYSLPVDQEFLRLVGRLKPGATLPQARTDLAAVAGRLRQEYSLFKDERLEFDATNLGQDATREIRKPVLAGFIGTFVVLLIACVNVASLLLVRASARAREIAIRTSLGASRVQIASLLVSESLFLSILGAAAALPCAIFTGRLLATIAPAQIASIRWGEISPLLFLFTGALCIGCALFCGLAPLVEIARVQPVEVLRASTRATGYGHRLRCMLIVAQVGLSFALLCTATLMVLTILALRRVNPGFKADKVLTFEIDLPPNNYSTGEKRITAIDELEKRLLAMPGVTAVGATTHLPLGDYPNWYSPYSPEGRLDTETNGFLADYRAVTVGYFQAMGAQLIEGRTFNTQDIAGGKQVVIIDDRLAREAWPGSDPLGNRLKIEQFHDGNFVPAWAEVVGVIKGIRNHDLSRDVRAQIYIPYTQSSRPHTGFAIRTSGEPAMLGPSVRRIVTNMDAGLAVARLVPMQSYVASASAPARFTATLAIVLGVLAAILATVGLYGVVYYSVVRRIPEIGIRIALGAPLSSIVNLVVWQGTGLTLSGISLGIPLWLLAGKYLHPLTYGMTSLTAVSIYMPAIMMIPLALAVACLKPARTATSVNPADCLRAE